MCTTDDPVDTLEWHQKIEADPSFDVRVLPAWRPEKAMNLTGPDYLDYLEKLETVAGVKIDSFDSLICALKIRMDFFEANGCRDFGSQSGLCYVPACHGRRSGSYFCKEAAGENITGQEKKQFETAFMLRLGRNTIKSWVMQRLMA